MSTSMVIPDNVAVASSSAHVTATSSTSPSPASHVPVDGHFGCLTTKQNMALRELQHRLINEHSLYIDTDHPAMCAMLLRFLRSVDFYVDRARTKLVEYMEWRQEYQPDRILLNAKMEAELMLAKFHILGIDCMGRPVALIHTRKHNPLCSPAELIERLMVYVLEYVIDCMVFPVEQFVLVLDHRSASFRLNFDLEMERRVLHVFQRYYPERMFACLVVHSPAFVRAFVNNFLKPWIAPHYLEKVHFLEKEADLLSWVPAEILPIEYGGTAAVDYDVMAKTMVERIKAHKLSRLPPPDSEPTAF